MCLFAKKYPEKVAGMVLVDGGSVDFYRTYFKPVKIIVFAVLVSISIILNKTGVFRLFGTMGLIPLVVITAGETGEFYKNWLKSQSTLLSLSTNSSHIIVENCGHFIHVEHPEIVNQAIKDMINKGVGSYKNA